MQIAVLAQKDQSDTPQNTADKPSMLSTLYIHYINEPHWSKTEKGSQIALTFLMSGLILTALLCLLHKANLSTSTIACTAAGSEIIAFVLVWSICRSVIERRHATIQKSDSEMTPKIPSHEKNTPSLPINDPPSTPSNSESAERPETIVRHALAAAIQLKSPSNSESTSHADVSHALQPLALDEQDKTQVTVIVDQLINSFNNINYLLINKKKEEAIPIINNTKRELDQLFKILNKPLGELWIEYQAAQVEYKKIGNNLFISNAEAVVNTINKCTQQFKTVQAPNSKLWINYQTAKLQLKMLTKPAGEGYTLNESDRRNQASETYRKCRTELQTVQTDSEKARMRFYESCEDLMNEVDSATTLRGFRYQMARHAYSIYNIRQYIP